MLRLRYLLVAAVAAVGLPLLAQAPPTAKIVTPPKEHFGFELGDDYCLANYKQLESYWHKLEKQTDRLKVVSIGKTEEGRDHLMAIVTSPANHAKLDRYKEIARKLATAEATPEEAAKLAEEGKAVVWIDGGLHASEVLCAQVLCESVYRFCVATDPESLRILDDVIILFAHANPDGMDLCADWYMRNKDKSQRSLGGLPRLYEKYAGHDNNRDFYAHSLAETKNMNRVMYREWFPQIVYDHHQTGPAGAVVFVPPCRDPNNYQLHPLVLNGIEQACGSMVQRLIMENKPGITDRTGAGYSTWWNGGLCTACQFHNMIGFFTETIGGPTPGAIPLIPAKLLPNSDYLYPITPQPWHFKQSLEYSYSGNRGLLDYASRNRSKLLHNIWRMGQDMVDRGNRDNWTVTPKMIMAAGGRPNARGGGGRGGGGGGFGGPGAEGGQGAGDTYTKFFRDPKKRDPRAYVIPADQGDFLTATKFVNTLLGNGCTVHRATAEFKLGERTYPAGSFVVKTAQPFRPHVLDMFEPQDHPDDIPYPGAPPTAPYDAAGYTLAYTMGVKFDRVLDGLDANLPLELVKDEEAKPAPGRVTGPANVVGYYLDTRANDAFKAANRLLKAGESVGRLHTEFGQNAATYKAGTFFVTAKSTTKPAIEKVAADLGVSFFGTAGPVPPDVKPLKPVRVGLFDRYGGSMPVGWTRMILERFEFPFTLAYATDLDKGNIKDRYDVLLFVEGGIPGEGGGGFGGGGGGGRGGRGGGGGNNANAPVPPSATLPGEPMPPQGATSVATTVPHLKKFLDAGGTIVTLGQATMATHVGLSVPRQPVVIGEDGSDQAPPREKYYIPSSVLRMKLDTTQPIAWGMDEYADTIFSNSPTWRVNDALKGKGVQRVGWFDSKTPLRSGWAMGQELLENGTTVIDAPVGKGHLVMVGPQILFRAQPHGCYKLVFNAIVRSTTAE